LQSANWASSQGGLVVSTVQLPAPIAGALRFDFIQRGPSAMNMVADPSDASSVYMSWSENLPFGRSSKNDEGKIHISKLEIHPNAPTVLKDDKEFSGFVVAGGIDITEDGVVGTLCAKYVKSWMKEFLSVPEGDNPFDKKGKPAYGPLLLAVCEVDTKTMTKHIPWRIGKLFTREEEFTMKGNYPLLNYWSRGSAGYGYLVYARQQQAWTTFYGATSGRHTGYAMHTYKKDAPKVNPEHGKMPVPDTEVENREETSEKEDYNDGRMGRGDHTAGAAMRYNPILGELYLQKHSHGEFNQQQYGFTPPRGEYVIGHKQRLEGGPVVKQNSEIGYMEGSLRPCGESMITAFISSKGASKCARISKEGKIEVWRTISSDIGIPGYDFEIDRYARFDKQGLRMTRLATLGSPESEAKCGSSARFLVGYETGTGGLKRWLLEIDGDCTPVSDPMDVTAYTTWPITQEWTTTRDGAVVWATAYPEGTYWPDASITQIPPLGFTRKKTMYPPRPEEGDDSEVILEAQGASQWAAVSVYWPSGRMPSKEHFPPGPAPLPAPVGPQPGPGPAPPSRPRPAPPSRSRPRPRPRPRRGSRRKRRRSKR